MNANREIGDPGEPTHKLSHHLFWNTFAKAMAPMVQYAGILPLNI